MPFQTVPLDLIKSVSPALVNVSQPAVVFTLNGVAGDGENVMAGLAPKGQCNSTTRRVCTVRATSLHTATGATLRHTRGQLFLRSEHLRSILLAVSRDCQMLSTPCPSASHAPMPTASSRLPYPRAATTCVATSSMRPVHLSPASVWTKALHGTSRAVQSRSQVCNHT